MLSLKGNQRLSLASAMNFQLDIAIPDLEPRIPHQSNILLIGSCFTEHMSRFLDRAKFRVMQNPHGILFNPVSVCKALEDVTSNTQYTASDLFQLNEYWHSWYHHSDFSDLDKDITLQNINRTIQAHHAFVQQADYVFITLGSAFAYRLTEQNIIVSNNHRAPSQWFEKELLGIDTISTRLEHCMQAMRQLNPGLKFVFTVSPVRHVRDGVIENNRSKARLLEAVHALQDTYYFPAYELVIDILRDYRFYDLDMVHPNYQATAFVWEQFMAHCIDPACLPLIKQLDQLYKAKHHRPKSTKSEAHRKFLREQLELSLALKAQYPYLDLHEEITLFSGG